MQPGDATVEGVLRRGRTRGFGLATASEYPAGPSGIRRSVEEVVRLIRLGYSDPEKAALVRGWLGRALIGAGRPQDVVAQVQALKDAFHDQTMYLSDPFNKEWIGSAASTLCLKPGECLPAGDCDDATVALSTITLLAGIPTQLVKQSFGPGKQQHILLAVQTEGGEWLRVDPSIAGSKVGQAPKAREEVWIDPMTDLAPQLVGIGRVGSHWHFEQKFGKTWATLDGSQWVEVDTSGLGAPTPYVSIVLPATVQVGLRYHVSFLVNALGSEVRSRTFESYAGRGAASDYLHLYFLQDWMIETLTQTSAVTGGVQSWEFYGIAKNAVSLDKDAFVTYTKLEVQSAAPIVPAQPTLPTTLPPTPPAGMGIGEVAAWALGIGAVGGASWALWRHYGKRGARRR